MKIAICMSGMLRTFKQSYKTLNSKILSQYDCDIFGSFWKYNGGLKAGRPTAQKNDGTIDDFKTLYNPKLIEYEDLNSNVEFLPGIKYSISSMYYKIMKCNNLRKEYELKNNINYDLIIRTRSDMQYLNIIPDSDIRAALNGKLVLRRDCEFNDKLHGVCIWDQLAIANNNIMNKYSDIYNNIKEVSRHLPKISPEKILKKYVELNNIETHMSGFYYNIIRDNGVEIFK